MLNMRALSGLLLVSVYGVAGCTVGTEDALQSADADLAAEAQQLEVDCAPDPILEQSDANYRRYMGDWWRWVYSLPASQHPVLDTTNDCFFGQDQSGNVKYLAGTFGGSAERTCRVSRGTKLFFPLFTSEFDNTGIEPPLTNQQLLDIVRNGSDAVDGMFLKLDGRVLGNQVSDFRKYRAFGLSSFHLPDVPDNIFRAVFGIDYAGEVKPAAEGGYWIMLKPLSRGTHHLKFASSRGALKIDVNYKLIVE